MEAQKRDLLHLFAILAVLAAALATLAVLDARSGVVQNLGSDVFHWLID